MNGEGIVEKEGRGGEGGMGGVDKGEEQKKRNQQCAIDDETKQSKGAYLLSDIKLRTHDRDLYITLGQSDAYIHVK